MKINEILLLISLKTIRYSIEKYLNKNIIPNLNFKFNLSFKMKDTFNNYRYYFPNFYTENENLGILRIEVSYL